MSAGADRSDGARLRGTGRPQGTFARHMRMIAGIVAKLTELSTSGKAWLDAPTEFASVLLNYLHQLDDLQAR